MDNVCDRSLISIPSKVEMAEEQEYLWSNKYVQIDINNQKWYRDRMTWSDKISISSKKSSARTSLAIRENRETWDRVHRPQVPVGKRVNAGVRENCPPDAKVWDRSYHFSLFDSSDV